MSLIISTTIGVVVYAVLYYIGSLFMRLVMVQVVESALARFLFASIFALSMGLLAIFLRDPMLNVGGLGMASLFGVGHPPNALFSFLFSALLVHLLGIPVLLVYLPLRRGFARRQRRRRRQGAGRLGGFSLFLFRILFVLLLLLLLVLLVLLVYWVGVGGIRRLPRWCWGGLVGKVAGVGVGVGGLMEGYAAFSTPYDLLLTHFVYAERGEQLRAALRALARRQRRTLALCASKRQHLAHCGRAEEGKEGGGRDLSRGFSGNSNSNSPRARRPSRIVMDAGDLSGVIAGFHQHSLFLFLSATAVDGILQATAHRKGISGRFWAFASLALGFYAAGKLTLTVIHIAGSTFALQDLLTRVVDLLQWLRILTFPRRFYTSAGDSVAISSSGPHTPILQLLAWVVNVWMILSSVRGLLLIVFQLTMTFSSITADTTAVAFSGMMGVYFIGQLVILQQSPPQASLFAAADSVSAFADVGNAWPRSLGPLPINFYQRLNEWCFVLGFTLTFFVRRYVLGDLAATTVSVAHG